MKGLIISLGLLSALSIVVGVGVIQTTLSDTTTLSAETTQYATTAVRVGDKTLNVELALTEEQQALGLGQRDALAKNTGMLFVFKPAEATSFWMKDMRFNIDIIWIADGKIVDISRNVPAPEPNTEPKKLPTYSPNTAIDYALELNAGEAEKMKVGDRVEMVYSSQV